MCVYSGTLQQAVEAGFATDGPDMSLAEGERLARLFKAVGAGDLAAVQAAVVDGASVRAQDDDGREPLHLACFKGHLDIAQWLHSAGASLDATDSDAGWTPLHFACYSGHLEVAQWLCSAGADATLKTNEGYTPAQLLQRPARTVQLDQQALRSTLACLVRRAQAQGPPPYTPLASVGAQN